MQIYTQYNDDYTYIIVPRSKSTHANRCVSEVSSGNGTTTAVLVSISWLKLLLH